MSRVAASVAAHSLFHPHIQALNALLCPPAGMQWAQALELGLGLNTALSLLKLLI